MLSTVASSNENSLGGGPSDRQTTSENKRITQIYVLCTKMPERSIDVITNQ